MRLPYLLLMLSFITACVTINVYFPAEAAEKAADRIILDVYRNAPQAQPPATPPAGEPGSSSVPSGSASRILSGLLDWLISPAQADADLSRTSPAIEQITARMEARIRELAPFYTSGAVGMTADGHIDLHDLKLVPLPQRNAVKNLIAEENRDRDALYAEMARVNGHPEWEENIRATFARRWVDNARAGWWYMESSGGWRQK